MWKVIAYGPQDVTPCIPGYVLLEGDDGAKRCIHKSDPRPDSDQAIPGTLTYLKDPCILFDGMWIAVEDEGATAFMAASEKEWRTERAQKLVMEAASLKGDPMRILKMVQAAGRLQGLDAPGLVRRLQLSKNSPDESLIDVLKRVKEV